MMYHLIESNSEKVITFLDLLVKTTISSTFQVITPKNIEEFLQL